MRYFLLISCGLLLSLSLAAQQRVVTGRVTVYKNMNLRNIKVESKKIGSMVATDSLGFYELVCDQKDVITFSAKTFITRKVRVKPTTKEVNVNMKFIAKPENVDMAVGYGYISKENATTAYSNLTRSKNDFCSYNNIYDLISGRCAGVTVGGAGFTRGNEQSVTIRGLNSVNQSNPLFIVDGVPTTQIANIHPCDVRSISFLKDSEAAIYGSQGGGGVILIQTKTGKDN